MTPPRPRPAPRPRRRQVLGALCAAGLVGFGAACARIPSSSTVSVRPLGDQAQGGAPYVQAVPPADGASPAQIVLGFVQAGVGPEDDYAVAREFLTSEASTSWDPGAGVTIYSGSQDLRAEPVDDTHVRLIAEAVDTVDVDGVRTTLAVPAMREITVELSQEGDSWRIVDPPDGIFLSEAVFESLFAPGRLYFVDARARHLVPDHRWFSLFDGASGVLARLADGPSDFLAGAVSSEVPDTKEVAEARVTTGADGGVQVTVPSAVGDLPDERRALALAQLEASLRSLRTLSGVQLVWDGADLSATQEARIERALPGHRPIAAGDTGIVSLAEASATTALPQLVPSLSDRTVHAPVIAQDGLLVAALSPEEKVVLVTATDGSVPLREAATGAGFVAPRIDDAGYVWTASRDSGGVLLALSGRAAEEDVKIDAPWLEGREVRALDVAADATRLIVLSADATGTRLDLCAIVRDASGAPSGLTDPRQVPTPLLGDLTRATWYDEIAVIVLGTDTGAEQVRGAVLDLATGRDLLPVFETAVKSLAGTAVAEAFWAGTVEGTLLRSDGEGWTDIGVRSTDPAFY